MRARAFGLFVAMIAAMALVTASGAATAKHVNAVRIDVSTRAAVVHYLRSIHVDPAGVVVQRGTRNYAGSSCPGKGWSCTTTTTHPVVQVAPAGGNNTFSCATASCAVVQVAPSAVTNTAKCIKTTGLSQSCTISQSSSSGNNVAIVYESALKSSGLTQTASSTASITQRATGSGNNTACVNQGINISGSTVAKNGTPVTVSLEAHQTVTIKQDSASGDNSAAQSATSGGACTGGAVAQNQTLSSTANGSGPITQNENAANGGANMTIDIEQNQSPGFKCTTPITCPAIGANTATFTQTNTLTAIANTPAGPVSQTQSSVNGGLLGTVNQDSTGLSTATTTQNETQCEDAAKSGLTTTCHTADPDASEAPSSLSQIQFGPLHKGVGQAIQTGNGGDTFTVDQTSTQDDDQGSGSQQTNVVQGDCHTSGNCTVDQTTTVDGQPTTNNQSGGDVNTQTTCTGSDCSSSGPSTTGTLTLLPNGLSVANSDMAAFGVGGMRGGDGTGSIAVSGITGPVLHAFLYWNGPTSSTDPDSNASVTFDGTPITGTNIGTASSNCWAYTNSQSYRADVTGLVTGDGTYALADFVKTNGNSITADINGVGLVIFYDNGNSSDDRNVTLWNGNDSNIAFGTDPGGWDETISGVQYPGSGNASLDTIVADGQYFDDPALVLNGNTLAGDGPIFQGDSVPPSETGGLWDIESFDITSLLTSGSNSLEVTSADPTTLGDPPNTSPSWDCLSLVVAAANVPASSGPILFAPTARPSARAIAPALRTGSATQTAGRRQEAGGIR